MLTIRHSGPSIAQVIASVQGVPTTLMPYAAATALTRCAKYAQATALPDAMRKAFDGPTPWTLNALRIKPASKDKLSARVLVKNEAGASAVAQEKYLQPEVQGGQRGHKRLENALRYQGILGTGQFAMPGKGMEPDANGNVKGADVRTILAALKNIGAASDHRTRAGKRIRKGGKLANDLFAGKPRGGNRLDGIWRREGHRLRALFIFTTRAPSYRQRLDFDGVVQQVALDRFKPEFEKAVAAQMAKGWK